MSKAVLHPAVFIMSDFGDVLVTRDQGEQVRKGLMKLLQEHSCVEVELDGVG